MKVDQWFLIFWVKTRLNNLEQNDSLLTQNRRLSKSKIIVMVYTEVKSKL